MGYFKTFTLGVSLATLLSVSCSSISQQPSNLARKELPSWYPIFGMCEDVRNTDILDVATFFGVPKDTAAMYAPRFQEVLCYSSEPLTDRRTIQHMKGEIPIYVMINSSGGLVTGSISTFFHVPLAELYAGDVFPDEANEFRDDFNWLEIIVFHQDSISSSIANPYNTRFRGVQLANIIKGGVSSEIANTYEFAFGSNVVALVDSGVTPFYANALNYWVEPPVQVFTGFGPEGYVFQVADIIEQFCGGYSLEQAHTNLEQKKSRKETEHMVEYFQLVNSHKQRSMFSFEKKYLIQHLRNYALQHPGELGEVYQQLTVDEQLLWPNDLLYINDR